MKTPRITKKSIEVSVCIPTFNNFQLFRQCVEKLKKATKIPYELLVLVLGQDETWQWCIKNGIKAYKHKPPFYFSQANNYLAKRAKGEYLLFLNDDTIPQRDFLEDMIEETKWDKKVAIVGAQLLYPNGTIQHAGVFWRTEYPGEAGHIGLYEQPQSYYDISRDVPAVTGACMLIRKDIFNELGGFDEKYKNGYEDLDLCLKAYYKDYKIKYCGRAVLVHYVGATKGTTGKVSTSGEFREENFSYFYKKWEHYFLYQPK